ANVPKADTAKKTLAERFLRFPTQSLREELEIFRERYEATNGPTDLTRVYTCMWPMDEQAWLWKTDPARYWDGLPPFVHGYMRSKMQAASRQGNLDDMPSQLINLYITGKMATQNNGRAY